MRDANDDAIVRTVVALAKTLRLESHRRGVEIRSAGASYAAQMNCDFAQGFLTSGPCQPATSSRNYWPDCAAPDRHELICINVEAIHKAILCPRFGIMFARQGDPMAAVMPAPAQSRLQSLTRRCRALSGRVR